MNEINTILGTIAGFVWGTPLIVAIIVSGIYLTIKLRLPQIRGFKRAIQMLRESEPKKDGELSHFQALSAALSATVGLGNIAGVAIAIGLGGPGAVFWMWIIGFIGMATKSASCTLAVKYRDTDIHGVVHGGPMYYIRNGMGKKWAPMGALFAILVTLASFGGGNMFQSNQVAAALFSNFGISAQMTGIVLAIGVGLVIIGGIKRIGRVASAIVPLMCGIYILGSIGVILMNFSQIGSAIALIFTDAFTGQAIAGGSFGTVVMQGVRRGTFSNEAGLGSAPIAHAAARTDEPASEGVVAALGPFIDTLVVCTFTALVIIFTGVYRPSGALHEISAGQMSFKHVAGSPQPGDWLEVWHEGQTVGRFKVKKAESGIIRGLLKLDEEHVAANRKALQLRASGGVGMTMAGFDSVFAGFGKYFVSLAVLLFAFSTMISWSYYGEEGSRYLWGEKAVLPFKVIFVLMIYAGANWGLEAVVNFSDIAYGLMAVPNLIALWFLATDVQQEHDAFLARPYPAPSI